MHLQVILDGDNCWPDLKEKGFTEGSFEGIALLHNGTVQGNATVTIRVELPDGKTVLAQTTLVLLSNAVKAFNIRDAQNRVRFG